MIEPFGLSMRTHKLNQDLACFLWLIFASWWCKWSFSSVNQSIFWWLVKEMHLGFWLCALCKKQTYALATMSASRFMQDLACSFFWLVFASCWCREMLFFCQPEHFMVFVQINVQKVSWDMCYHNSRRPIDPFPPIFPWYVPLEAS